MSPRIERCYRSFALAAMLSTCTYSQPIGTLLATSITSNGNSSPRAGSRFHFRPRWLWIVRGGTHVRMIRLRICGEWFPHLILGCMGAPILIERWL